jgi:CBS domain-containing protein
LVHGELTKKSGKEATMQLVDVMTRGAECIRPKDSVMHAAERMKDLEVGSLPVCDENDRLAGMITDRDITVRCTAVGGDAEEMAVADVMTPGIVYCFEDDDIQEAARKMEEKQIRRLAVLDRNKRLVGIVALGDLAVRGDDAALNAEALERISEPARPVR